MDCDLGRPRPAPEPRCGEAMGDAAPEEGSLGGVARPVPRPTARHLIIFCFTSSMQE